MERACNFKILRKQQQNLRQHIFEYFILNTPRHVLHILLTAAGWREAGEGDPLMPNP